MGQPASDDDVTSLAEPRIVLRDLFEHSPVPYAIFSRDGGFLLANPAYRTLFGGEPARDYSLLADARVEQQGLTAYVHAALAGETVCTETFWHEPHPREAGRGSPRVAISATFFPLHGAAGEVGHIGVAYRDVTSELLALEQADARDRERVALQAQLRSALASVQLERSNLMRSEADFRAMFELSAVGMAQVDPHTGRFIRVNARLSELTGYSGIELLEKSFSDLTHPDDRARDFQAFARMVRGEHPVYQIEKRYLRKDGGIVWVQVTGAVVRDASGEPTRSMAMHVDVSERHRVEEQAKAISDNATMALLLTDHRMRCVFMNPAAEKLTGYTLAELADGPLHAFVHHTRPDGTPYPIGECSIHRALPAQRNEGEEVLVHRDGHFVPVAFTASPLCDDSGAPRGTVIELRDTTREKLAQEERDRLLHELEQAVRVRDDFLSIAGHEVRTPLTALMLNLQTVVRSVSRDPELERHPRLLPRLLKTQENAERLQRLIEELLDVSRIAAGRLRLTTEEVDLASAVRSVASRHGEQVMKSGSELRLELTDSLWGTWDRFRVEQVVSNLITNALKYGEGKPVDISLHGEGNTAVLRVRDHGIGIDPEDHARIFERFERAVSNRHYGGLGLGLWIVRQVVEASGGAIRVESTPGRGSLFEVRLPIEAPRDGSAAG